MASIVVLTGMSRGNFVRLTDVVVTIGRDERCDMQVLDEKVSRRHMHVAPAGEPGEFVVEDLSANGVSVNGRRIGGRTPLRGNDVIVIGDSRMVFTLEEVHDAKAAMTFAAHGQRSRPTIDPAGGSSG